MIKRCVQNLDGDYLKKKTYQILVGQEVRLGFGLVKVIRHFAQWEQILEQVKIIVLLKLLFELFFIYSLQVFHTITCWWLFIERQQASSGLQDSSQYSGWTQQCCDQDALHFSYNFQFLLSFFQISGDSSKHINYEWYQ